MVVLGRVTRAAAVAGLFVLGCGGPRATRAAAPAGKTSSRPSLSIGTHIPALGCFGIASSGSLVACVVGSEGHDDGFRTQISVAFASLSRDLAAPDPIPILDSDDVIYDPEKLPLADDTRRAIDAALTGFVAWQPVSALHAPATAALHDTTVVATRNEVSPSQGSSPATFDARLEVHARDGIQVLDEVKDEPVWIYDVRLFDAHGGVVIEREKTTQSEGAYAQYVDAWACHGATCLKIE